jgi:hypothetical protein
MFCALAATAAVAAEPPAPAEAVNTQPLGLFEAIEVGRVEAKLIPKDAASGTVILKNLTGQPLSIKLPAAFAGVPVVAQAGAGLAGGNGLAGGGGVGGGNSNQGFGGGFGGYGGGQFGGGGGFFSVPAGRPVKLKTVGVCLEHGKADPNPRVPYELRPIESFTQDAAVIALVEMLARGQIDQRAAQAAAWHLANGLSWEALAAKIGVKHLDGSTEPYFSAAEIGRAYRAARLVHERAAQAAANSSRRAESASTR